MILFDILNENSNTIKWIATPIIADGIKSSNTCHPIPNPAKEGIAIMAAMTELLVNNSVVESCLGGFLPSNKQR